MGDRRKRVPLWKSRGKVWDDHVTSLHETPVHALEAKKKEIDERRRWLRANLKTKNQAKQSREKKNRYVPNSMASLHAIQLGTPEVKRREYDQRRAFLRGNLREDERAQLARKLRNT